MPGLGERVGSGRRADAERHGGNSTPNTPKSAPRLRASDERAWRAGGFGDVMRVELASCFTTGGRARQPGGGVTIGDVNR